MTPLAEKRALYRMSHYEECVGIFHELKEENSMLVALIGKINVVLPIEIKKDLHPYLGKRLAILKTDDQARPYRWRSLE